MRRTIAVAAAIALLATLITGASAQAAGCVSKKEFKSVKNGMSKKQTHAIFGTKGKQMSFFNIGGETYETRKYKPCVNPAYSFVWIDFVNKTVDGKTAYWG